MNRGQSADGSGARLATEAMPVADRLRMYLNSQITKVEPHRRGVIVHVHPPGRTYIPARRLLLIGLVQVVELLDAAPRSRDDEQAQADIGDDMYERSRYDEQDIDIEPDREATRSEEPR